MRASFAGRVVLLVGLGAALLAVGDWAAGKLSSPSFPPVSGNGYQPLQIWLGPAFTGWSLVVWLGLIGVWTLCGYLLFRPRA